MRAPASEVSPFDPLFWHSRAGAARRTNPGAAVRPPRVRISRMHPALASLLRELAVKHKKRPTPQFG